MFSEKLHAAIATMYGQAERGGSTQASVKPALRGPLIVQVLMTIHQLQKEAFATDVDRHLFGNSSTRLPQIHSALKRLVDGGYLQDKQEFVKGPQGGRPKRRYFVTAAGLTEIRLHLADQKSPPKQHPRKPLREAALARSG